MPTKPRSRARKARAGMQDQTAYAEDSGKAPSPFLMMLEGRAFLEGSVALAALPWLRQAPEGDGHPVLVLPGLGANDVSTVPLRNYLRERGYAPHPWNFGFNFGARACLEIRKQSRSSLAPSSRLRLSSGLACSLAACF